MPIPRLHSVSQTGLIKIVWDRAMQIPLNLDLIPRTKYVMMEDNLKLKIE